MKKIIGLLALTFVFHACDDGEITIDEIDFSEVSAARCDKIIYKLKDSEAFFFEVANPDALFVNDATLEGQPRFASLADASNRVFYRAYNGTVTSDVLCGTIPPATPNVIEEWTFTGDVGRIEVTTTPTIVGNTALPGGEKITNWRHVVNFTNVDKNTPSGSAFGNYPFGLYTAPANTLPFAFGNTLSKCGNIITAINGSEGISLDIAPSLIVNTPTAGTPRKDVLGTTTNKLVYTLFQSAVTAAYFCTTPTPATPLLKEQWIGDAGVLDVSGTIEVTTTESGPNVFVHEIHLKKVRLRRGNSSFILADDYLLGTLTTSN